MDYSLYTRFTVDATRILVFQLETSARTYADWAKKQNRRVSIHPFTKIGVEKMAKDKNLPVFYDA